VSVPWMLDAGCLFSGISVEAVLCGLSPWRDEGTRH
jgi:hypothetical protein